MNSLNYKQLLVSSLSAMMDAMASVLGANVEIILHDLSMPDSSVIKIVNGQLSGRKVGSGLQDGPDNDLGFMALLARETRENRNSEPTLFKNYRTTSAQGKTLRSATVFYKDAEGQPILSLCINSDSSIIEGLQASLAQLLPAEPLAAEQESSLEIRLNEIIAAAIPPAGVLRTGASKAEKIAAVRRMQELGLFIVRGGVERAAKALGVTRYTIYNYLEAIKNPPDA